MRKNKAFTETFRSFIVMLQRLCSFRNMGKSIPRQSLRWLSSSSIPPPTPAIPPGLLQYLEKKEQEESYGRSQSQLANLHSALRRYTPGSTKDNVQQIKNLSLYLLSSCVEEHEELEMLAKEEGEEMKKLVEADLYRVRS